MLSHFERVIELSGNWAKCYLSIFSHKTCHWPGWLTVFYLYFTCIIQKRWAKHEHNLQLDLTQGKTIFESI